MNIMYLNNIKWVIEIPIEIMVIHDYGNRGNKLLT